MPADSGLRAVNTMQLAQADGRLWREIAALRAALTFKGGKSKKRDGESKAWQANTDHLKDDKEIATPAMKNLALTQRDKTRGQDLAPPL